MYFQQQIYLKKIKIKHVIKFMLKKILYLKISSEYFGNSHY